MDKLQAKPEVKDPGVHSLRDETAVEHVVRIAKVLGIGAQGHFVKIEIAGMVVVRIRAIVDLGIVQEFAQKVAIGAAALHLGYVAILKMDLPARIESNVALGSRDHAVDQSERLGREPFFLNGGIVDDRVSEPAGRLRREEKQMTSMIGAFGPSLGLDVADFRVGV